MYATLLLFTANILAESVDVDVNITGHAISPFIRPYDNNNPTCFVPVPGHTPPPARIMRSSCLALENNILLSPYAIRYRNWAEVSARYPIRNADCFIGLNYEAPLRDPSESFAEYRIAVAAATIIDYCDHFNVGGAKFVTIANQFVANVKHPSALAEESVGGLVPLTNTSVNLNSSNTLTNGTSTATTTIGNLNNPVACYDRPLPGFSLLPVSRTSCLNLFHTMLTRQDLSNFDIWTGIHPEGPWKWGDCHMSVLGNRVAAAAFRLIDVVVVAARIVQTCLIDRGLVFGGGMGVPGHVDFHVQIINSDLWGQNLTAVE